MESLQSVPRCSAGLEPRLPEPRDPRPGTWPSCLCTAEPRTQIPGLPPPCRGLGPPCPTPNFSQVVSQVVPTTEAFLDHLDKIGPTLLLLSLTCFLFMDSSSPDIFHLSVYPLFFSTPTKIKATEKQNLICFAL